MEQITVIAKILMAILIVGGSFIVIEVFKQLLDRAVLQHQIRELSDALEDSSRKQKEWRKQFKSDYAELTKILQAYKKETGQRLVELTDIAEEALLYAENLAQVNTQFMERIDAISACLNEETTANLRHLIELLQQDIQDERAHQKELEIYRAKRRQELLEYRLQQEMEHEEEWGPSL